MPLNDKKQMPSDSDLRWVLQHKRRWPVFLAVTVAACLTVWLAALANGRRLAQSDLQHDQQALQELVAAKQHPPVEGDSVASILARAAALLPELPDYQYRMDQKGPEFDWHSAWRHESFFTGPDNLVMINEACAPAWQVFDTLTDELPSAWQVIYADGYGARLFMIDHLQKIVKALRLRIWCAARRGDWETIHFTAERWAMTCDRVAEIGFLITNLVAIGHDDFLCHMLIAAGNTTTQPISDTTLERLERLAQRRAHRPGSLAKAIKLETTMTHWSMSLLAVDRHPDILRELVGYELRSLAQPAIRKNYPLIYPLDRAFSERMMTKLHTVSNAIDQMTITATNANTGAATLDREFLDFRVKIDPRYPVTYLTFPAIEMIGRNTVNARHRWLQLPIALRLLQAAHQELPMDLRSTGMVTDRLVDPASPSGEAFRLEQCGDAWLLRGRGFDDHWEEEIEEDENLSKDAGLWLYPALLDPSSAETMDRS